MNAGRSGLTGFVGTAVVAGVAATAWGGAAYDVLLHSGQALTIPGRPDLPALEVRQVLPPSPLSFAGGPSLNAAGHAAATVRLQETTGASFGDGVFWFDTDGTLVPIALANDLVPGQPAGVTYDQFLGRRLILDASGNLAFGSQWERTGTTALDTAIQVYTNGGQNAGVRTVVRDSPTEPQPIGDNDPVSPTVGYEFTALNGAVVNAYGSRYVFNSNRLAFGSMISPPSGQSGGTFNALYRETNAAGPPNSPASAVTLLARNGTGSTFIPSSEVNALNANSLSAFRTTIFPNPPSPSSFSALVTFFNDVSIEVQSGSDAGGDISFSNLSNRFGFNNAGQVAFTARFSDLTASDSGVFKSLDPDGIVATEGIVAAGTPDLGSPQGVGIPDGVPDFVFQDFAGFPDDPLINGNGTVVFRNNARTPDGSQQVTGLWTDRSGPLTALDLVALTGQQAPGLPDGFTFTQIANNGVHRDVVINGNDDIAFVAQFMTTDGRLRTGLWAEHNGELELVVAQDFSQVQNPDGSVFRVEGFGFLGGSGNQDGRPSGFSDNGTIAFRADGQGSLTGAMVVATLGVDSFLPGDFNASGQVEQGDLDLVLQNWGVDTLVNGSANIPTGWINFPEDTSVIDQNELDAILQNWGSTASPDFALNPDAVPEPATVSLLALPWVLARRCRRVTAASA